MSDTKTKIKTPPWLRVQRLAVFLYFASGVLLFVHALGFITNTYVFYAYGDKILQAFYNDMQLTNLDLFWASLLAIIFAVILLLLDLHHHAAGPVTLVISAGITGASALLFWRTLCFLSWAKEDYLSLDLSSLDRYIKRGALEYKPSIFIYDSGLALDFVLLAATIFLAAAVFRNAFCVKDAELSVEAGKRREA